MNQAELSLMRGMIDILNRHLKEPFLTEEQYNMRMTDLKEFEEETGFILSNSPTDKERMNHILDIVEMTNISKRNFKRCNDIEDIVKFANEKDMFVYPNLTGVNMLISYSDGIITKLEVNNSVALIDFNKVNIPYKINKKGVYDVFGFLQHGANFYVSDVIHSQDRLKSGLKNNVEEAEELGFTVVPNWLANNFDPKKIQGTLEYIYDYAEEEGFKHDGIVFEFNDISYSRKGIIYEMIK